MKIYFDNLNTQEDMMNSFAIDSEKLEGVEILYACYSTGDYEGWAHVIFRKEGKLYEVNGSHCSCYGLEGQWKPEETSVAALLFRPNVADEAKEILRQL
jgi:hypothetical protein